MASGGGRPDKPSPTTAVLAAYAAPALPLATLTLPLYIILPTYYSAGLGLSLVAVGQALLWVRVVDAVSDPLIGWFADRTRPAFGRRRLWFLASLLPTALAAAMLFMPPEGAGIAWLFGWGAVLSLATTACLVPYWAWGAELATDYAGRNRIIGAREAVVVLGTLVATGMPALTGILGYQSGRASLVAIAGLVVLALPVFGAIAVWRVPEPREHSRTRLNLRSALNHLRANGPFRRLLAAFVLNGFANGLPATLFLFFVSQRLDAPQAAGPLLFLYFLCGILGVPLWLALSRRTTKHHAWSIAMMAACAVFLFVPLLGPGDVWLFAAICVFTGLALGADLVLPSSIQADVIDVDTAASGEQRTGFYVAAWGLATKLALALAVGVAFPLLQLFGFDPQAEAASQAGTGLLALAVLYALVPVAAKLGAIALMWRFPVDREEQERLRRRIEAPGVLRS